MNGRKPTLGDIARLSCLERLFAVLLAFIVFSALPGMAPLVATYGHLASDAVASGRTTLIAASGSDEERSETPNRPGQILLAGHWRNLSLIVAYEFDSDDFLPQTAAAKRHNFDAVVAPPRRSCRVGATTSSYDAQGPPAA